MSLDGRLGLHKHVRSVSPRLLLEVRLSGWATEWAWGACEGGGFRYLAYLDTRVCTVLGYQCFCIWTAYLDFSSAVIFPRNSMYGSSGASGARAYLCTSYVLCAHKRCGKLCGWDGAGFWGSQGQMTRAWGAELTSCGPHWWLTLSGDVVWERYIVCLTEGCRGSV